MKKQLWALALATLLGLASISAASAAPGLQGGGGIIHYVGFGETVSMIAAQYGVPVEAILQQNGLTNPNLIYVGQPLIIPGGYGASFGGYSGCTNVHTVVAGETLSSIAYSYGVNLQELIQYNNLYNSDIVYVGQQICLPPRAGYAPQPAGYQSYNPAGSYHHTVAAGETLFGIADRYRCSYLDIMRLNSLQDASIIRVGQRLLIPPPLAPQALAVPAPGPGPYYAPPPAPPAYNDSYDRVHHKPPIEKHPPKEPSKPAYEGVPAPPDYQAGPVLPILPIADHPIEVVVNGGMNWVGEVYPSAPDPNAITTLIVNTTGETTPTVRLRSGDYEVKGTLGFEPEFGIDRPRFVFRYIPPGDYDVWLEDPDGTPADKQTPSQVVRVKVKPGHRIEVAFRMGLLFSGPQFTSPDGWFLADWSNPSVPKQNLGGWSNILIKTPASGLNILIESEGGGYKAKCFTGSKGPGACDFAGLNAGIYFIKIDGTQYTVKTYMDGNAYATFTFARQPTGQDEGKVGPVSYD
jgi:LysM repeat protein